jgi:hypothetical protein
MRKNPHAVALGKRKTAKKAASSRRNGLHGGRPATYRLTADGSLERLTGERWVTLEPPYDEAAKAYLRRR